MSDSKEVVSVRMGDDMKKQVEKYRVEKDMSQADAFRELLRKGLESEEVGERLDRIDKTLDSMIGGKELKGDLRKIHDELGSQRKEIKELEERQKQLEQKGLFSRLF